jgi:hypothetical protein
MPSRPPGLIADQSFISGRIVTTRDAGPRESDGARAKYSCPCANTLRASIHAPVIQISITPKLVIRTAWKPSYHSSAPATSAALASRRATSSTCKRRAQRISLHRQADTGMKRSGSLLRWLDLRGILALFGIGQPPFDASMTAVDDDGRG